MPWRPIGVPTHRDGGAASAILQLPFEETRHDCAIRNDVEPCVEKGKIRRVPVVDTRARINGIVSLADIVRCADAATTVGVVREVSTSA